MMRICSLNWAASSRCSSACGMGSTRPEYDYDRMKKDIAAILEAMPVR